MSKLTNRGINMEIIDKRILDKLPEDERKQHEEGILKHLPDCSEKCELVDIDLLMAQIPLRSKKEESQEEVEEDAQVNAE